MQGSASDRHAEDPAGCRDSERWAAESEVIRMARNGPKGGGRIGAVKGRSQFKTPQGLSAKRDAKTGRIMDVKTSGGDFKGVRREK